MMPLVFISYNRQDGKYARALSEQLKARGISVFLDIDSIAPSQQFPQATAESVAKCDLLILLWSHNSAASKFVTDEWNIALAKKKAIFPVLLDDCPLPAALSAINAWKVIPADKLANRVVGLVMGGRGEGEVPKPEPPIARKQIGCAFVIVIALIASAIMGWRLIPFWQPNGDENVPPPTMNMPAADSADVKSTDPDDRGLGIPELDKLTRVVLSGEIYDDVSGALLEGIKVCAMAYNKNGQSISSAICNATTGTGHFEIELAANNAQKITLEIDGETLGYEIKVIDIKPQSRMQRLHYSLKKI